ncbi:MAG: porin [Campylobacterales bacterium]|nr:porin [Campylobacterales bacterium]
MKLAKLSLAAIVAAGAMTTFASAAPLEEAIKGVDLTGSIRYRVDMNKDGDENHRFGGFMTFTAPIADGLKSILTLTYDNTDKAQIDNGSGENKNDFDVRQAYFQYTNAGLQLNVGKMTINTPWTYVDFLSNGANYGNGVMAYYTGVEGWTFGAGGFANTNIGVPLPSKLVSAVKGALVTNGTFANAAAANAFFTGLGDDYENSNLYAAAAIGSMGPVNAQVWVAKMQNVFDHSTFVELSTKFEGFSLKAQANYMKLADELDDLELFGDDDGLTWAAEAGFGMSGFGAKVGYIKTDKDMGIYALNADHKMIRSGKQLYSQTYNLTDAKTYFGEVSYKFDKYSVGAGYSKTKADSDKFGDEWYVEAGYAYSKNFALYTYYSDVDYDVDNSENKRVRVQAQYKF